MTEMEQHKFKQLQHISMVNSYNLITKKSNIDDIVKSNLGAFVFIPNCRDEDAENKLDDMISYFMSLDMLEYCSDIIDYKNKLFSQDTYCICDYPKIKEYEVDTTCGKCDKIISIQ